MREEGHPGAYPKAKALQTWDAAAFGSIYTRNAGSAVGLGKACEMAKQFFDDHTIKDLTDHLFRELTDLFGDDLHLYGHPDFRLPNTLYVSFKGYSLADVKATLGNVAISTGSACHSDVTTLSPVLQAMGVNPAEAAATIRFSLGRYTTEDEVDTVLRNISGLII